MWQIKLLATIEVICFQMGTFLRMRLRHTMQELGTYLSDDHHSKPWWHAGTDTTPKTMKWQRLKQLLVLSRDNNLISDRGAWALHVLNPIWTIPQTQRRWSTFVPRPVLVLLVSTQYLQWGLRILAFPSSQGGMSLGTCVGSALMTGAVLPEHCFGHLDSKRRQCLARPSTASTTPPPCSEFCLASMRMATSCTAKHSADSPATIWSELLVVQRWQLGTKHYDLVNNLLYLPIFLSQWQSKRLFYFHGSPKTGCQVYMWCPNKQFLWLFVTLCAFEATQVLRPMRKSSLHKGFAALLLETAGTHCVWILGILVRQGSKACKNFKKVAC